MDRPNSVLRVLGSLAVCVACVDDPASVGALEAGDEAGTTDESAGDATSAAEAGESSDSSETGETGETSGTTGSESETQTGDGDTAGDDSSVKFDLGRQPDAGAEGCGGGGGLEFSFIWVTSSELDTVSKIDTQTFEELGRYYTTDPGTDPNPSRTSVNRLGDMVVANRNGGGVTKIATDPSGCVDQNMDDAITTSQGPDDVLPWGSDECVLWNQPLPGKTDNRPVAWTNGVFNEQTCAWEEMFVWTSATNKTQGSLDVFLLDGETGAIAEQVNLNVPLDNLNRGMYGAAVDENDDVWMSQFGEGHLVKVHRADLSYEVYPYPPGISAYGLSLSDEYVWLAGGSGITRFRIVDQTWDSVPEDYVRGLMADPETSTLWVSRGWGVRSYDMETLAQTGAVDFPPGVGGGIWGIGIDFDGYVWAIPNGDPPMYRVDPDSLETTAVDGPPRMYTYSDMTGFLLSQFVPAG